MRHGPVRLVLVAAGFVAAVLPLIAQASPAASAPGIGRTQVIQGFAVTPRWVKRAREAGAADYVAARGNVFLLIDIRIVRQGSHDSYYLDPQDFHVMTSGGDIIDSEQFGLHGEMRAHHIYTKPAEGVVGFEVPSKERHLTLLWQPALNSNPDAEGQWSINVTGAIIQYYP
ncbi:MAG TPA: hypothetical protein VFE42_12485 [Chloroflexota bacterium]|nr:hypothetical protein [Chloroflexota bacterium]